MTLFSGLFKSKNPFGKYASFVAEVNSYEQEIVAFSDVQFPEKTKELMEKLQKGEDRSKITPYAFALVREAVKRTLNQRPYDVQLIGGAVIDSGNIAEMRTGEGKTLVATLPAYMNALEGKGVHVVTVNDYLALRDAAWMGQIYSFLGLSVGVIVGQNKSYLYDKNAQGNDAERDEEGSYKVEYDFLRSSSRKEAYSADITYGTNSEFGFDYLRDNLAGSLEQVVASRGYHFAIVDEIDSILIDEARTPLIISQPDEESGELYKTFARIAKTLIKEEDYTVDEKMKAISLTDVGITKTEKSLNVTNIYTEKGIKYVHHLENAVRAQSLYHKDKDYVVKDNEIIIVDSFTGRMQPGRRWSEGLHQAIEAKEGVKIEKESRTVASITYQNFFRFYKKLSGMTGTAETSKEEFYKVYGLDVQTIPTHKPVQRIDNPDLIFQTEKAKFKAIAKKVKELQEKGQPVLIGTVSIEKNELLSAYLNSEGVKHTILNAKNHEREGEIVADAGKKGSVIVATNMAGRGVDIKLGGTHATHEEAEEIRNLGGLYVLGTERHEARRIDNQLRGRSGRQGDKGETQFFVSLEDDVMRIFGSERVGSMMKTLGIGEDEAIQHKMISRALETAQTKIEGFHFDARKHTLEYDNVLSTQRNAVYGRRRAMLEDNIEVIKEFTKDMEPFFEDVPGIIEEKITKVGEQQFWDTVRRIILYVNDTVWVDHLETMDHTRSSVNLRAYGQREPLIEYKREALRLYKDLELRLKEETYALIKTIDLAK